MSLGIPLAALAMMVDGAAFASYAPKMRKNRAEERPVVEQTLMGLAIIMAVAAFFLQPGLLGALIAVAAILPAGLFLAHIATSKQPAKAPNMTVGAMAPDFSGWLADGGSFQLSEHRGRPLLIKFFRGTWCAYCRAELRDLVSLADEFAELGVTLVAVSTDTPEALEQFNRRRKWPLTLVADPDGAAHKLYNVEHRELTPDRGPFREVAIPATVLIGADGRVLWYVQTHDFRVRPPADWVLGMVHPFIGRSGRTAEPKAAALVAA